MSDAASPGGSAQATSLRRRAHAKKTCVECRRKRARCDLPDTSIPCSTEPLAADKACHRCKMLGVPCVVSDEGLKRKRGSDGTGSSTPNKAKASSQTAAGNASPARAKVKTDEDKTPANGTHAMAMESPQQSDATLSRSRANSLASSKRDPLSLHGAGVNSRLHVLNPFPGPLQMRNSEALARAEAAGSPGAASSSSSSYRSRVGLPSMPSAASPRGPGEPGSATTPVAAVSREAAGSYLYHSQSGGQGSSSRSFKMATSFNRRPLALLSELCTHQPGFGEELGRQTLTNFLSQSLDVLGVVSEELAVILERELPELLLFFPHLPSLRALREEHKVAPTISTSVLLSLMYMLLCSISDPVGARSKTRSELNNIVTRDAPHLLTGSRDLNAITALELLSVYAPLTLSPPMSHRKSATSPPSAARAGTRVSGEGLIMVAMAIARSFRMNEAPAKLSRLVEEESRAGLRTSPDQRRSRLEQVVEQLHFAAQWYSLCTWEACAAFADQDIVPSPAPSPGFNPATVLSSAQDLLAKSIGADALDESAETFAARNVGRICIARRLRVYEMTFDGFGVMTDEVRWADEVTEKRNRELVIAPGREDEVEHERKEIAKQVHGRVLESMERFLDRWMDAYDLDGREREKDVEAIRVPKQLRGRVRSLLNWLAMESAELHSLILTNMLIVATLTRNFGVLQGPPTPSLIIETISKNTSVTAFASKISTPIKDGSLAVNGYMIDLMQESIRRDEAVRLASGNRSSAPRGRQHRADSAADVAALDQSMAEDAAPLSIRAVPLLWSIAMAVSGAKHSMENCAAALYGWRNLSSSHDELQASVQRLGDLLLLLDTDAAVSPGRTNDSIWQQNKIMQGCLPITAAVLVTAMGRAMEEWRNAFVQAQANQSSANAPPPTPPISAGRIDAKDPFVEHEDARQAVSGGVNKGQGPAAYHEMSAERYSQVPSVLGAGQQRGGQNTHAQAHSGQNYGPNPTSHMTHGPSASAPHMQALDPKLAPPMTGRGTLGVSPTPAGNGWIGSTNGYYQTGGQGGTASPGGHGATTAINHGQQQQQQQQQQQMHLVQQHAGQQGHGRASISFGPTDIGEQQMTYLGGGGMGAPMTMGPPALGGAGSVFSAQPSAVDLMLDDMLGGFDWVSAMPAGGPATYSAAPPTGNPGHGHGDPNAGMMSHVQGQVAQPISHPQHHQTHLNGQHAPSQQQGVQQRFGGGGW